MATDGRTRRGAYLEGAAVGPHVAYGCVGAGEHVGRPPHAGKGGADDTGQTLDLVERCSVRSRRRRDRERQFERAAGRRGETAGVRPRGRRRTTSRPSARSGDGLRLPGTPCSPTTRRRGDWAGGTGARGTPGRGGRRGGAPPRGRRSTRPGHRPLDRSRPGTPRVRGVGRDGDQAAGSAPGSESGRCRRKVPVARLTSTPSALRTVASP